MNRNCRLLKSVRAMMPVLVIAAVALATPAHGAYVITAQGQKVEGSDIRARPDGEIILSTPQGTRTFYKGQYSRAVADKPADFDKAVQLVEAKQFEEAIKILDEIALRYRHLEWDIQALTLLPQVHVRKGDPSSAIGAYEKLFAASPKSSEDPTIQWSYRQVLLDAKRYDKLEPILKTLIASGSRADAAKAQIMRGDVRLAQNELEPAALDYLRTVVLFKSELDSQPEALFKAAETLEKLRDPRAKDMYKRIVDEFPASPFSAKARAKL